MPWPSNQRLFHGSGGTGPPNDLAIEESVRAASAEHANRSKFQHNFRAGRLVSLDVEIRAACGIEACYKKRDQIAVAIVEPVQFEFRGVAPESLFDTEIEAAGSLGTKVRVSRK